MNNKAIFLFSWLLLFPLGTSASSRSCNGSLSPSSYEDCFAFNSIVRSIVVSNLNTPMHEIPREWIMIKNSPWELGLIVLDRSTSQEALESLAYLNAFSLDGALSEIHTCNVLKKGKLIIPLLNEAMIYGEKECNLILKRFNIEQDKMCVSKEVLSKNIENQIKLINKGVLCEQ